MSTPNATRSDILLKQLEEHPFPVIDLKLVRMETLLERLGSPHLNLPPVVHVAGTNGKGSLIAYLKAMLEAHGLKAHVYTSPHLVKFHERIVVAGKQITENALVGLLEEVIEATQEFPVTYFEATTAMAFLAFSRTKADIVLLETGLGGRLDATNVIPKPALTAITPISIDHEKFLGDTLQAIATEKAGILKEDVPCVVAKQPSEAMSAIAARAKELKAPLYIADKQFKAKAYRGAWDYEGIKGNVGRIRPALEGIHQGQNVAVALACMELLAQQQLLRLSGRKLRWGAYQATWPARLQRLTKGNLPSLLYGDMELWLDGAHNEGSAKVLADWLRTRSRPMHVIIGMVQGRDPLTILQHILPHAASLDVVTIPKPHQSIPYNEIIEAAQKCQRDAHSHDSIEAAVEDVAMRYRVGHDILICGSLYLAGHVLTSSS
jgi:dihydrofolate synthase/folylpolyglutamate synthase